MPADVDRYYVQQSVCGQYWNIYDRRTPCETNRTGHACLAMISIRNEDAQQRAENIAARYNGRPLPHPDHGRLEVLA